jgi:hypothetical protein
MLSMKQRLVRTTAIVGAVGSTALIAAGSAAAGGPTGIYSDFSKCPIGNSNVTGCLYQETTGGSFQLGNANVPINKKILLQGGYYQDATAPTGFRFVDAVGADTLQKVPLDVPGGLTGLVVPSAIRDIPLLGPIFDAAVNAVNGVTATAELVQPVGFNFTKFLTRNGPTVILPVRIKLDNPFLGSNCYIGSASNPVTLSLTTGTTAPPAPNSPISGNRGTFSLQDEGKLTSVTGYTVVDNAFAAPAASNCGPWGFQWAVTPIVNLKEGLPAAAGKNAAILSGNKLKAGDADAVRASVTP